MRPSLSGLEGRKGLVGCEIGVDWGIHAEDMLKNLDMAKLYLVDSWEGFRTGREAKGKLAPYADRIVWLEKRSGDVTDEEIPPESLDFCYVDGGHDYETVKGDLEMYWSRVKVGGILAGHDYKREEGVHRAVNEFWAKRNLKLETLGEDWWIWRPPTS